MSIANRLTTKSVDEPKRNGSQMPGPSEREVIALVLGLITGIIFCELVRVWQPVGDILMGLLIMVV